MRRNVLLVGMKMRSQAAVARALGGGISTLRIAAAPLSSVSGGGDPTPTKVTPPVPPNASGRGDFAALSEPPSAATDPRCLSHPKESKNEPPRRFLTWRRKRSVCATKAAPSASVLAGGSPAATVATVGFSFGPNEAPTDAFARFAREVGGCLPEDFLAGAKQAYYSTAVLIDLLASYSKPAVTASSLSEVEEDEVTPTLMNSDEMCALVVKELSVNGGKDGDSSVVKPETAEATQERNVAYTNDAAANEKMVKTITSVLPISHSLAETIYKMWTLQNEGKANLFSIAAPSDYILDSKLLAFVRLDSPTLVPDSSSHGLGFQEATEGNVSGTQNSAAEVIHPSTLVHPKENTLNPTFAEIVSINDKGSQLEQADGKAAIPRVLNVVDQQFSHSQPNLMLRQKKPPTSRQEDHSFSVRVRKLLSFISSKRKEAAMGKNTTMKGLAYTLSKVGQGTTDEGIAICVNGNTLSTIPSTARACVLLSLDTVVPPSRYTSNYEWYYKRIIGFESETEHIMMARVFSQNSPIFLFSFFDFLKRMLVGGDLQFVFNKAICEQMGVPENASKCTPVMRKLMCMYMDSSKRWVLSDLVPLSPAYYKDAGKE